MKNRNKMITRLAISFLIAALGTPLFSIPKAFSHGGGEAVLEAGPGKGVTEILPDRSFRLAPEAMKTLGIEVREVQRPIGTLPRSAISRSTEESEVFRFRAGYFKAITIKHGEKTPNPSEFQAGDSIATKGVGFLRIISSQIEGDTHDDASSDAHKHETEHQHE
jgi:hypothetical protein